MTDSQTTPARDVDTFLTDLDALLATQPNLAERPAQTPAHAPAEPTAHTPAEPTQLPDPADLSIDEAYAAVTAGRRIQPAPETVPDLTQPNAPEPTEPARVQPPPPRHRPFRPPPRLAHRPNRRPDQAR
ncbi:hypothetical protein NKH18_01255 [Streptomyces sp. M10(2022)]